MTSTRRRTEVLEELAQAIAVRDLSHPVRVAVDGPDGSGKSVLADELATFVEAEGRSVIRASIDGFHRPRAKRLARFGESPEGYYRDSFDHDALREVLLEPLGPTGDLRYRRAVFDYRRDGPTTVRWEVGDATSVLIFDGVFLLRPELRESWDFSVFVTAEWDEILRRVVDRDSS